ncbi:MAG TPA: class I SAM-dependent RNA methyltransferase [Myxococcota bacterium]|nr:class I SAM-dependent RNA methyltransferase [Myxococcota bacterium]
MPRRTEPADRGGPPRDEIVEVRIDSLAAGGDGVGRAPDGRVVFVPFTAPGDLARVAIRERRARWLRGESVGLLEAGPGRTDPLCPVFGTCGGCDWQHLAYPTQIEAKRALLADAIQRIARLPLPERFVFHGSPAPYGYRSRARVAADRGRVGFRRRRSHAVCAVSRCPVLVPALDAPLAALTAAPPARDAEWELTAGADGAVSVARLPVRDSGDWVPVDVLGERLRISAGSFLQANEALRGELARIVVDAAGGEGTCLELFAGAGFFTLPLARRFARVVAVEANPGAVADLEENLAAAGLGGVEIVSAPVERALEARELAALLPEVVVLDPPRTGLSPEACEGLLALGAPRIVYVSCDPATLARDVALLADRGYALDALEGFDLFPQTAHVEAVARLERPRRTPRG